MLDKMRGISRPVIWIVAIVFIGGMATMGISSVFQEKPYVGNIAGEKIKYDEYYKLLQNSYTNYMQDPNNQNREMDEATYRRLNDQTWEQLVQRIILEKEIAKLDIKVSAKEIAYKMVNDPPEMITSYEAFLNEQGQFDKAKYVQALQNPQIDWSWLSDYYEQILKYEKLQEFVNANVIVTEQDVKDDYIERNTKVDAEVIIFAADDIDSVFVADAEIEDYYNSHLEEYMVEPQRKLHYVKIPLQPSPEDIKAAEEKINKIHEMAQSGEDFAELAREYSEGPSGPEGGDLGYFKEGQMVTEFNDVAFSMEVGEISKPVQTQFGWHIILLTDKRTDDQGNPEVKASHILIKEEPSADTRRNLETIAQDFYERALEDTFKIVADNFGLEIVETDPFTEDEKYIRGIGRTQMLVNFAFNNDLYAVAPPYRGEQGEYYIAQISYEIGNHYKTLQDAYQEIYDKLALSKKMDMMEERAESIFTTITAENFDQVVQENNLKVVTTDPVSVNSYMQDIGREPTLVQEMIELKDIGSITEPVRGSKAYFIGKIIEYLPPDMEKYNTEKDQLFRQLQQKLENQNYNQWYAHVKEEAKIKDWRGKFFRL